MHYYERNVNNDEKAKVGEGEVLYTAPRRPEKGVKTSEYVTWEEALRDIEWDLEAGLWGTGPELSAEEVGRLTFCCCVLTVVVVSPKHCAGLFHSIPRTISFSHQPCSQRTTGKAIAPVWKLK